MFRCSSCVLWNSHPASFDNIRLEESSTMSLNNSLFQLSNFHCMNICCLPCTWMRTKVGMVIYYHVITLNDHQGLSSTCETIEVAPHASNLPTSAACQVSRLHDATCAWCMHSSCATLPLTTSKRPNWNLKKFENCKRNGHIQTLVLRKCKHATNYVAR